MYWRIHAKIKTIANGFWISKEKLHVFSLPKNTGGDQYTLETDIYRTPW